MTDDRPSPDLSADDPAKPFAGAGMPEPSDGGRSVVPVEMLRTDL